MADSFRWLFQGEFYRGPIPGTHPGRLAAIAETGPFIRFLSRFTAVYMHAYVFLRFAFQCVSMAGGLFRVLRAHVNRLRNRIKGPVSAMAVADHLSHVKRR